MAAAQTPLATRCKPKFDEQAIDEFVDYLALLIAREHIQRATQALVAAKNNTPHPEITVDNERPAPA